MKGRLFQKIHPLNWPLAFAASLAGPVSFWRSEFVPQALMRRFAFVDPAEHFSLDDWQDEMESAFAAWRDGFDSRKPQFGLHLAVNGTRIDFSGNWQQWLALLYEERHLFLALAARAGFRSVAGSSVDAFFEDAGLRLSRAAGPARSPEHRLLDWLDRAWNGIVCLMYAGRAAVSALRRAPQPWPAAAPVLWTGISASEFADADRRLDFSFLAARGLLCSGDQFYVLPTPPPAAVQERLSRLGVAWLSLPRLGGEDGWRIAGALAWHALVLTFTDPAPFRGPVAARYHATAAVWLALQRRLKARVLLTSVSNSWPEGPEVAALQSVGVKTVNWAYSGNAFRFAGDRPGYRDRGLLRSITVARELWVWNAEYRDWLEERRLGEAKKVSIIGPIMAGDASWLALTPPAARERFGVGAEAGMRYVALFDVATLNRNYRRQYGFGPTTAPLEMLRKLYVDMLRLLDEEPGVRLIFKPKRAFDEDTREYPDSLTALLQSRHASRILVLDHRIDPYIPIALAEASVGNAFASPVLAAHAAGRIGIFHDPLGQVRQFFPPSYEALMTRSYEELKARLAAGPAPTGDPRLPDPGVALADRINSLLHER